ncbi:MAG: protein translocase subunit SecD [Fibrobacter sp.]|nr:protein translocase subunit SecD [Fibrobacter sp.]
MKKSGPISILIVLLSVVVALLLLTPSFIFYSTKPEQRDELVSKHPKIFKKVLNLGLDLQGGMRLVLEVDRSSIEASKDKDLLDRAYTIIENRINGLGVAEPVIQKQGNDRIIVELPGLKDEKVAKEVIGKTAQLQFHLLREPAQFQTALSVIDNVVAGKAQKDLGSDSTKALDSAAIKEKERQKLAESLLTGRDTSHADTAAVDTKTKSFMELLAVVGDQVGVKDDDFKKVKEILARQDVRQALESAGLGSNAFLWSHDTTVISGKNYFTLYYVKANAELRGDIIKDAVVGLDQMQGGNAKVDLTLNTKGAHKFSSVTAANVNKFLAIVLDSTVYSAPRIIQKISGGRAEITGSFTTAEAKNLALVLRAGALPAPVKIIEERTVGPSLGFDSINKSFFAGLAGTILVVLFMFVYYKKSGGIAIFAMVINIIGVLAAMAAINATLTLPGIAGIILQVGMGVDASVLILERIREELRLGKTVRSAIDAGFERAFVTILDSNLTTIVTALLLLWKGTGPIRGFSVTLILGLLISLFTALFITRVIMDVVFKKNNSRMSI